MTHQPIDTQLLGIMDRTISLVDTILAVNGTTVLSENQYGPLLTALIGRTRAEWDAKGYTAEDVTQTRAIIRRIRDAKNLNNANMDTPRSLVLDAMIAAADEWMLDTLVSDDETFEARTPGPVTNVVMEFGGLD